jgi:hypothetical protein
VEWLLNWAYAREKVHLARMQGMGAAAGFGPRGYPGAANSERIGAAVGSSMNLGFEAPADAYAVMRAVLLTGRMAGVVREYAIIGARPDWTPYPSITVERGPTGHALHLDKKRKRHICPFRLFYYRGDLPEIVAERRQAYERWARAISDVHASLSEPGMLGTHTLADALPPPEPWLAGA